MGEARDELLGSEDGTTTGEDEMADPGQPEASVLSRTTAEQPHGYSKAVRRCAPPVPCLQLALAPGAGQ